MFRNLIAEQARARLTNQQVANYLGVSRPGYEAKKRTGRFNALECSKLCRLFGCEFEYLFSLEEPQACEETA